MSDEVDEETEEQIKPVKEIVVVIDQGFFTHATGDTYDGSFEVRKKDRFLKMCGPGVYTTAQGDVYSGTWDADRLVDEVTVTYTDGSRYEGPFKDGSYSGRGKYTYPDSTVLACDFSENCPLKDLLLTDPNGHVWLGRAETGYGWLDPWNHFYQEYQVLEKKEKQEKAGQRSKIDKAVNGSTLNHD